jgi:hypothetical protein
MKARLAITYIFNLIDLIATMYLVSLFGLSVEGNPIGRWLIRTNLVYLFKIGLVGGLLLAIGLLGKTNKKAANIGSWVLLAFFSVLFIYHAIVICCI